MKAEQAAVEASPDNQDLDQEHHAAVHDGRQEPESMLDGAELDDEGRKAKSLPDSEKSVATILVEMAEKRFVLGVSEAGETFGVPRKGPRVVRMLRGGKTSLRAELSKVYFRRKHRVPPQEALSAALNIIDGIAQDTEPARLHLRVAEHKGAWWLDLGDSTGRAVQITSTGWSVQPQPPEGVLFKRTALTAPLPDPVRGADLGELWQWLNVAVEDQPIIATSLVACLVAEIPHPIVGLFGEQGTGKSTAQKVLVSIVDPSAVPTRKAPRDAESWVTAAAGSWVVGLDNLSGMPEWLSDSLCRAVTGDGDVRRKLYTDGELAVFAFRRCLVINGIDLGAVRGDLGDRLLPIQLEVISEADRRTETEFWPLWTEAHPRILGAVLDLAASVKAALPSVHLEHKPRMADYALLLSAVDHVLGTQGLPRYVARQGELATDSLTGDPFVTAMAEVLIDTFTGTSAEWRDKITPTNETWRAPRGWPKTPREVTALLRRQAPVMRKAGWTIHDDGGANHSKSLRWTITPPPPEETGNPAPQDPQDPHPQVTAGNDGGSQRGSAGQTTLASPADPHPDPRLPGDESAGHSGHAGHAGVAGHQYPLSRVATHPQSSQDTTSVSNQRLAEIITQLGGPATQTPAPEGDPDPVDEPSTSQ